MAIVDKQYRFFIFAMDLMQEATGMTRRDIEDLIHAGETFDGADWQADVSLGVDRADFDNLSRTISDLAAVGRQGIPIDLSSINLASQAQIQRAVEGALLRLIRTGSIRNVYL